MLFNVLLNILEKLCTKSNQSLRRNLKSKSNTVLVGHTLEALAAIS